MGMALMQTTVKRSSEDLFPDLFRMTMTLIFTKDACRAAGLKYMALRWMRITTKKKKISEKDHWIYIRLYPTRCTIADMHA